MTQNIGIITIRMNKYHLKNLYFDTFDSRAPRLQVFSWSWYSAQSYACAFGLCAVLNSFLGSKFQFVFRRRCNIILYPKSKWHVCSHFHVSKLGKGDIRAQCGPAVARFLVSNGSTNGAGCLRGLLWLIKTNF